MSKRRKVSIAIGLGVLLFLGLWVPRVYWVIRGGFHHEVFCQGMPASYWIATLRTEPDDEEDGKLRTLFRWLSPFRLTLPATDQLYRAGVDAVPVLVEALAADDAKVRARAAAALWKMDPEEAQAAVPALVRAMHRQDPPGSPFGATDLPAVLAADALGHIGAPALPALKEVLHGPHRHARLRAIEAVAAMGPAGDPALPDVMALLREPHGGFDPDVVEVLGAFGPRAKPAVPALLEALKDNDPRVQWRAGEALRQIDPDAAAKAGVP